jgi:DNA-binding NarL/FixJ family response regulator
MGEPLRVVVADDSALMREGLAELLTSRGFDVVGRAGDGDELLKAVAEEAPDVAVVDIRMPPTGTDEGLRAAARIGVEHPAVAVIILSEYLDATYAKRLLESDARGRGYLLKESVTDLDAFAHALRRVAEGQAVIDASIVRRLMGRHGEDSRLAVLSPRELEILEHMAQGRTNRGIADALVVSERTVESTVRRILIKLGVPDSLDDHKRVLAVLAYLRG